MLSQRLAPRPSEYFTSRLVAPHARQVRPQSLPNPLRWRTHSPRPSSPLECWKPWGGILWLGSPRTSATIRTLTLRTCTVLTKEASLRLKRLWKPSRVSSQAFAALRCLLTIIELGFDGDAVGKSNFPLPTLGPKLEQACHDVHGGTGFAIVRGLDPARHTAEDNLTTFLAVADYIGDVKGVQDRRGSMISERTLQLFSSLNLH
jgi:hypothetical protein